MSPHASQPVTRNGRVLVGASKVIFGFQTNTRYRMIAAYRSASVSEALRFFTAHMWILSVLLLVFQTNCFTSTGPPALSSPPECFMPCDEKSCISDIHCTWEDRGLDHLFPTNYILHWKTTDNNRGNVTSSNSLKGVIQREDFINHEELSVWVEAENQHGSGNSKENVFNTADIIKPPPPKVTLTQQEPLEIEWLSFCDELQFSAGTCDVRYRIDTNPVWSKQYESGFLQTYVLDNYLPGTVYAFQVRCACRIGLMSDWSAVHKIRSEGKAPVGELDVWMDCSTTTGLLDCILIWKELPLFLARGVIMAYEVVLFYSNGTSVLLNVFTPDPKGLLTCSEMQCYFNCSLKDISSVNVSALNAHGATVPSHLKMPILDSSGQEKDDQIINLMMTEQNLTVSWELPTQQPYNLKIYEEYVVQYKQVGTPPGVGFDWVKVNKSQKVVFFKGHFRNYTPYRVSLFTVSHGKNVHFLSSNIGYSLEGAPSKVQSLKVLSIADTQVTLFWESDPLYKQKGLVLYYQVGTDSINVYNVSTSPLSSNETFVLKSLRPGQEYQVWIRAVTKAGPGANNTATFKTIQLENDVSLLPSLTALFLLLVALLFFLWCYTSDKVGLWLSEKVPDPSNSQIFKHLKMNDASASIFIPILERHPSISVLEVVNRFSGDFKPNLEKSLADKSARHDEILHIDRHNEQKLACDRADQRCRREEYSKMVDSDEEGNNKVDSWSSSEEEEFTPGYEKHFMPTALDILEG
ncbi:interleukin 12 receptor, beta 2a, like isoform X3 [Cynoglossus semilaevis]|uniref:interleukin 12 receptor, beta 2a, like isoform X3 n=1 Tax=Cynoglossus semilaevis TaxID=244447 RepID=UPI000D62DCAB|nr:interleukin-12 receptor subunit beta-2-like isoform X3 [Cynoglossus semilaevis]